MSFYPDNPAKLTRVSWYFVDRTDFVPETPFVSSQYDEFEGMCDGCLGEQSTGQTPRKGSIPPGAGIAPLFAGTDAQWGGELSYADRVKPQEVCAPVITKCVFSCKDVYYFGPCSAELMPYRWNSIYPPVVTINGQVIPMTLGPYLYNGQPVPSGPTANYGYWYGVVPENLVVSGCPNVVQFTPPYFFVWNHENADGVGVCPIGGWRFAYLPFQNFYGPPPNFVLFPMIWPSGVAEEAPTYDALTNTWTFSKIGCIFGVAGGQGTTLSLTISQRQPPNE